MSVDRERDVERIFFSFKPLNPPRRVEERVLSYARENSARRRLRIRAAALLLITACAVWALLLSRAYVLPKERLPGGPNEGGIAADIDRLESELAQRALSELRRELVEIAEIKQLISENHIAEKRLIEKRLGDCFKRLSELEQRLYPAGERSSLWDRARRRKVFRV